MTPDQIAMVERSLTSIDLDAMAVDFYERAFAADPAIEAMFTTEAPLQRARFTAELAEIVRSIRSVERLASVTRPLGARHRHYGVQAAHYRVMGQALLGALAQALGDAWTEELHAAWTAAYNLTAETMLMGAEEDSLPG